MSAIVYVRVSSDQQVDGTSLETQEQRCRDCAARYGLDVVAVESDAGVSAKSTVGREGLARAVSMAKRMQGVLIVYKFDRLARNTGDAHVLRESLLAAGCRVISATEGEAEATPVSKMMYTMLSAFAELDNDMRAERCRGGMAARAKEGCWVGHAPRGYIVKRVGRRPVLEADGTASEVIREAYESLAAGTMTPVQAERHIKHGARVCRSLAWRILRMPVYGGMIQSRLTGGERIKAAFPGLVSEETWTAAQERFHQFNRKDKEHQMTNPDFPLTGILRCPVCGEPIRGGYTTGNHGKTRYGYYFCSRKGHVTAKLETVHLSVTKMLRELVGATDFMDAVRREIRELADAEADEDRRRRARVAKQLEAAEAKMRRARKGFIDGLLDEKEYADAKQEIGLEIVTLRSQVEETESGIEDRELALDGLVELVRSADKLLERLEPSEAKSLMEFLFGEPVLTREGIEPSENSAYKIITAPQRGAVRNGGGEWI